MGFREYESILSNISMSNTYLDHSLICLWWLNQGIQMNLESSCYMLQIINFISICFFTNSTRMASSVSTCNSQTALTIMLTEIITLLSSGLYISAPIVSPFSSFSWQNHFSTRFISPYHSCSFIELLRRVCSVYVSASSSDPAWGQNDSCDSNLKVKICLHTDTHERERRRGSKPVCETEHLTEEKRRGVRSLLAVQFQFAWFKLLDLKLQITT